jgi:hypothetical protein
MAKRGPAPRYKPDFCPIAYKFCLLGATNDDLAGLFEVSLATIGNWLRKYPAFRKAVQDGHDVADADVAHSLHQQTKGFTHPDVKIVVIDGEVQEVPYNCYFPPDRQVAIFWLRNRRRQQWREVIVHELERRIAPPREMRRPAGSAGAVSAPAWAMSASAEP